MKFRNQNSTSWEKITAPPPIPAPALSQTSGLKKQFPSSENPNKLIVISDHNGTLLPVQAWYLDERDNRKFVIRNTWKHNEKKRQRFFIVLAKDLHDRYKSDSRTLENLLD